MDATTQVISLTPSAIAALKDLQTQQGIPCGRYLRVGVKGGGCAGMSYILDFDEKKPLDEEYNFDGVKVVVDQRQAMYLMGIELDYQSGLNDRGFIFNNPNATSTCGCGTSFSA